ncbi:unnamed protein product [Rotaria magnacalcarata]|uniref:Synaptic plasticity regulator PANTS n=5 Tax=Rotaria magnacalcarata TaxID=392030 RepID=A0A816XFK9_9BILA|nr:unnamed protein product [Rotaria magnacalcarata]CAF2146610.1 unnamed protein product [Rotaria magnacalcarata]CAF3741914.1 unnamed protein product [Rotaria magnacalcarata]CAF4225930.1 unnamed protein product [Rotaria magnacalcarata]
MSTNSDRKQEISGEWLIRPCEEYNDELSYCRSWRGRLYQRYMLGQRKDCAPIAEALHNCMFWLQRQDVQELKKLIVYEEDRHIRRKLSSENNDVWQSRTRPPSDWNAPLPDWARRRAESIGKQKQNDTA